MAKKINKGGRPSGYDPKFCEEILKYFDIEPYREVMKKIITKSGDVVEIPEDRANDLPTLSGFARQIRKSRDTLHEWTKVHPEFAEAYAIAKECQYHILVTNGMRGLYNASFAIMGSKNIIQWRDRFADEPSDNININVSLADRVAKARARVGKK